MRARTIAGRKTIEALSMEDAYSICREMDRPIDVLVDGKRYRIYPSGHGLIDVSGDLACSPVWIKYQRPE